MARGSEAWSDMELAEAVRVYVEMRNLARQGLPFVKKEYYDRLAAQFGRTSKAFEYRMQNISYVYSLMGRTWLPGLLPARNVGVHVVSKIQRLIEQVEGQQLGVDAGFEAETRAIAAKPQTKAPPGSRTPGKRQAIVTEFVRDPSVVAWVLKEAAGICESCLTPAPFTRDDGTAYLEVHHLIRLADGGPDTIDNAVGICANCHRRLHYGSDRSERITEMQRRIARLRSMDEKDA